jgi:predicted Rossmann fold flavoprotein
VEIPAQWPVFSYTRMDTKTHNMWDVVVVGGGPAGMLAAGRAAERGLRVLLLEKNTTLGRKLLITGGGRCNVTNNKPDARVLLPKYKGAEQFLYSAFSHYGVKDALAFFNERGMDTKEENEGRMFPTSNTAQSVWDVLVAYMKKGKVAVRTGAAVTGISKAETGIVVHLGTKERVPARACVVAAGGTSRPETGSTGESFAWLRALGHTVKDNDAALVPLTLKDTWTKKLAGVALGDVKLTVYQDDLKQGVHKGKMLFTHVGISGPAVLNMSRSVGELLQYGEVVIKLDLVPGLDYAVLKEKLQELLITESNKKIKNTLGNLVPKALVPTLLEHAGIDGDTPCHSVRREERIALIETIKAIPLRVKGLLGKDKAIVSSGGVVPEEVNFKTMESRIVPGLYVVGDMLHIDRPSGGYSLQLCWTTGYVAGSSV